MKKILLLLLAAITSCAPVKTEDFQSSVSVDYFSKAVDLKIELLNSGKTKWAKIVIYSFVDASTGETQCSYCVAFMYPTGENELRVSDTINDYSIKAYINDPLKIAQMTENVRGRELNIVTDADFYE
jgi:hypothetical protein